MRQLLTSVTPRPQVISITDGEPAGEPNNTILQVIKGAKNLCANSPYGPGAIAFQIAQVRGPASSPGQLRTKTQGPSDVPCRSSSSYTTRLKLMHWEGVFSNNFETRTGGQGPEGAGVPGHAGQ